MGVKAGWCQYYQVKPGYDGVVVTLHYRNRRDTQFTLLRNELLTLSFVNRHNLNHYCRCITVPRDSVYWSFGARFTTYR